MQVNRVMISHGNLRARLIVSMFVRKIVQEVGFMEMHAGGELQHHATRILRVTGA